MSGIPTAMEVAKGIWQQSAHYSPNAPIPKAVQDAAAQSTDERHRATLKGRHRKKFFAFLTLPALMTMLGGGAAAKTVVFPEPPPTFWVSEFEDTSDWKLVANRESSAQMAAVPSEGSVWVTITRFGMPADQHYFVNLRAKDPPSTMEPMSKMTIRVRGQGLETLRVYPRAGKRERWRSPAIPVTQKWSTVTIPLSAFEHERGGRLRWMPAAPKKITDIDRLQIKFGYKNNPVSASGSVGIDEIRFD